jgi:hypothetical protein
MADGMRATGGGESPPDVGASARHYGPVRNNNALHAAIRAHMDALGGETTAGLERHRRRNPGLLASAPGGMMTRGGSY